MGDVLEGIAVITVLFDGVKCRRLVNNDGVVLVLCGRCRVVNLLIIVSLLSAEDVSSVTIW
jgi:hypothetical protein